MHDVVAKECVNSLSATRERENEWWNGIHWKLFVLPKIFSIAAEALCEDRSRGETNKRTKAEAEAETNNFEKDSNVILPNCLHSMFRSLQTAYSRRRPAMYRRRDARKRREENFRINLIRCSWYGDKLCDVLWLVWSDFGWEYGNVFPHEMFA